MVQNKTDKKEKENIIDKPEKVIKTKKNKNKIKRNITTGIA